ncbi:hypothetical protein CSB45_00635 [candidate division KSB3 bacterium]|uniref:TonB C-terminal domain-containing protein n=1 Tax=candidate division KSB3 bacterium TaxID=2044937 RepID=A0A2G6EDZ0_9BACT|nr:MAG: hypothetical protein CSB45_00635 [candidate division KSB3 bacterium]PIE31065.1 MAG: hypothetical protein CSA57_00365 [candidate division KSB3 bacterium]
MSEGNYEEQRGFRWILLGSVIFHFVLLAGLLGIFYQPSEVAVFPTETEDAQFVDLLDSSELPEELSLPTLPSERDTSPRDEQLAFRSISSLAVVPSPTATATISPSPLPTATPAALPTLTPTFKPLPSPTPIRPRIPVPKFNWTPKPTPTRRETVKPAIRLDPYQVPRRHGVLDPTPVMSRESQKDWGGGPNVRQQHFLGSRSSLLLDQENDFPFPGYLQHLEKKIAGLWFPQGAGTVTIFLEVAQNGKILKSEVDKGTEVGVEKLHESVVRALSLIKHFEALPWEYRGRTLRVRIIVRR